MRKYERNHLVRYWCPRPIHDGDAREASRVSRERRAREALLGSSRQRGMAGKDLRLAHALVRYIWLVANMSPKTDEVRWAFTGTQRGLTHAQYLALDNVIRDEILMSAVSIAHGGCLGADIEFHELLLQFRLGPQTTVYPSNIPKKSAFDNLQGVDKYGVTIREPRDPLERNRYMIHRCDRLLACPGEMEEVVRSGTWATVRHARRCHRRITFVWPNGTITHEGDQHDAV